MTASTAQEASAKAGSDAAQEFAAGPAYTAKTEADLMAKCVKKVEAYRLECKYCKRHTPICADIGTAVAKAQEVGMMIVDIDRDFMDRPTLACADCAKRDLASFRHQP